MTDVISCSIRQSDSQTHRILSAVLPQYLFSFCFEVFHCSGVSALVPAAGDEEEWNALKLLHDWTLLYLSVSVVQDLNQAFVCKVRSSFGLDALFRDVHFPLI